jgi:chemotaxis protein MotB
MSQMGDEEESVNNERWMVSFADFMTLLFALFAVLYATSTQDVEKTKQFQDSIRRYLIKAGAFGGSGEKVNQGEKFNNVIEPPIQTYGQPSPLTKESFDEAEVYIEEHLKEADRRKYVVDVAIDELGVRIVLSGAAVFPAGNTKFKPEALPFLDKLATLISHIGRRVLIEGHSPESFSNPTYPSAWEFAGARASSMVRYFSKRHDMKSNLFMPISYGSTRPLPGKSDRIEIVLLTEDVPL